MNAPAFTIPEEGTYKVVVAVTDSAGTTPITVSGTSQAVIADAALTAGAAYTPARYAPGSSFGYYRRQLL